MRPARAGLAQERGTENCCGMQVGEPDKTRQGMSLQGPELSLIVVAVVEVVLVLEQVVQVPVLLPVV